MASPPLDSLRAALTAMPPGTLVPRDWVLEQLPDGSPCVPAVETPTPPARVDLTIRDLAELFGKQPSTVRGWVERGDFPGAYKLHGKEWRVPVSAVEAFQDRERDAAQRGRHGGSRAKLSEWRRVTREAATQRSESGPEPAARRSPRGHDED